jgi:hypothetical protein
MEQLIGTQPYRFEVISQDRARALEYRRRSPFGTWWRPRVAIRWISCATERTPEGTQVRVTCSSGGGLLAKALGKADHGPVARALQLVKLLTAGRRDPKTIYRERPIPPGPVSLVASWAGMGYQLYTEPHFDAGRGATVLTATEMVAIPGGTAAFVKVRCADGTTGYVERDQLVPAPAVATREAQTAVANLI